MANGPAGLINYVFRDWESLPHDRTTTVHCSEALFWCCNLRFAELYGMDIYMLLPPTSGIHRRLEDPLICLQAFKTAVLRRVYVVYLRSLRAHAVRCPGRSPCALRLCEVSNFGLWSMLSSCALLCSRKIMLVVRGYTFAQTLSR